MKKSSTGLSRRQAVARSGLATASLLGLTGTSSNAFAEAGLKRDDIAQAVAETPFADSHEHLVEEHSRTDWTQPVPLLPCADWALLFSHYLNSDLIVAGMPGRDYARFTSPEETTDAKWRLIEPHWTQVRHTGYARAVRIAIEKLYGISELNARSVHSLADRHAALVTPGFYNTVLREHAGVESCQVNSLQAPFMESRLP